MEKSKIDAFLASNASNFKSGDLALIKNQLENLEDDKFIFIQSIEYKKPDTIFIISILLGLERFWLNDTGMGIVKLLTWNGCMIWWLIDIFSAKDRTYKYNINEFNKALMLAK